MTDLDRFTCFEELPPEIQSKIWDEASKKAGCAALNLTSSKIWFSYIGASHAWGGRIRDDDARNEDLTQVLLKRLWAFPPEPSMTPFWFNLEATVFYLGDAESTGSFLNAVLLPDRETKAYPRFKHVAVTWREMGHLMAACKAIAEKFPTLESLIVQRMEGELPKDWYEAQRAHISPELGLRYAIISQGGAFGLESWFDRSPTAVDLGKEVLGEFGDSPPRLSVLRPDPKNYV